MLSRSKITLLFSALLITFGFLSCIDDEENRLQTNVAVEGREMFDTSFALSEHLYYIIQPFSFFEQASTDTIPLPGCPIIEIDSVEQRVNLVFNILTECPNSTLERKGRISLYYTSFNTSEDLTYVEYFDYSVKETTIEGSRLITKRAALEGNPEFKDAMASLIVLDEFGSSTRVNAEFVHQLVMGTDSLPQISTLGSGGGRNLAGRAYNFEITTAKIQQYKCINEGIFMPNIGMERWTFERTVTPAVTHRINYGESDACDRSASVALSTGEILPMSQ